MKSTWIIFGRFSTTISSDVRWDRHEIHLFSFGDFKSFDVNWWSSAGVDMGMVIPCLCCPKSENQQILTQIHRTGVIISIEGCVLTCNLKNWAALPCRELTWNWPLLERWKPSSQKYPIFGGTISKLFSWGFVFQLNYITLTISNWWCIYTLCLLYVRILYPITQKKPLERKS